MSSKEVILSMHLRMRARCALILASAPTLRRPSRRSLRPYQRRIVAPQVRPVPNATISTMSPDFSLPFCLA